MSTCTDLVSLAKPQRPWKAKSPWVKVFLTELKKHGSISRAQQDAKDEFGKRVVSLRCVYDALHRSPAFARAVRDCQALSVDRAVSEVYRRGIEGYKKPLTHKGYRTGHYVREFSDALAIAWLKAKDPAFARDGSTTVNIDARGSIVQIDTAAFLALPLDEQLRRLAQP